MQFLDLTLPTPAENIALDEALLDEAEAASEAGMQPPDEVLRLWEPRQTFVVLGQSSQAAVESNIEACRQQNIPVLRRCSGGLAIVTGPGCLMYALILNYSGRPHLREISKAHAFVLEKLAAVLRTHDLDVHCAGTSDLAIGDCKFSGNSLRCRREHLLYHGTLLYDFPLQQIGQLLRSPPRQPDYRAGRTHDEFVTNLPLARGVLRAAVREAFGAKEVRASWPQQRVERLIAERIGQGTWTWRR